MDLVKFSTWFGGRRSAEMAGTIDNLKLELEGQLAALHNAALVSETDVRGSITFVNDTFCAISGYTREELMGQNHRILKSGQQPQEIFVGLWRTISEGRVWSGEVKNRRKDGTFYWVWATITPVLDPVSLSPVKYVSVRFDITRIKELEQAQRESLEELTAQDEELRQNMEELEAISDNLRDAQKQTNFLIQALDNAAIVSMTDVRGYITYVNEMFCSVSGYAREELMGQNHNIVRHPDMPAEAFKQLWDTISAGKYWKGLVKNKRKDGSYYWVMATITPQLGPNGKPERYISIRFEVTTEIEKEEKLKQTVSDIQAQEEEIRQTMEELQSISDHLMKTQKDLHYQVKALDNAAIVSVTDVRGNIIYVNDTFCEISQYSRQELMGQNHRILKSGHQPDEIFRDMWASISQGNVWRGIVKNKKKHGGFYWVMATITPVLDDNGKPERYIGVRVDITSEKEKEQLIAASDQSIQELNASLSLAKDMLEKKLAAKTTEIHDSVLYAQRLQRAILTPVADFTNILPPDYAIEVLFQPKDVVSGDFYWGGRWKNKGVVALGDGTGHGVPGAFMTILGMTNIQKLVEDRGLTEPASLLEELDTEIRRVLQQNRDDTGRALQDSLEMSVLTLTDGRPDIQLANAMRPAVLVRANGDRVECPFAKKSVGGTQFYGDQHFVSQSLTLEPGDSLYLFSDGFQDQFGGPGEGNKKFGRSAFYDLLSELNTLPRMQDRNKALYKRLTDWRGFFHDQTDDVTVLMIRR